MKIFFYVLFMIKLLLYCQLITIAIDMQRKGNNSENRN